MSTVKPIITPDDFTSLTLPPNALLVLYFHAPWAAPCAQMSEILDALASTYPADGAVTFASVNAEELPDLSEDHDVTAVPYIVLKRDGKILESISGSEATRVRDAVEKHASPAGSAGRASALPPPQRVTRPAEQPAPAAPTSTTAPPAQPATSTGAGAPAKNLSAYAPSSDDAPTAPAYTSGATATDTAALHARLAELVKAAPVMLFMKGTPSAPQCGFSRQLVSVLREQGVRYGFFNILADDEVRQGLKTFADWPTFPQLWLGGELVGGLDIVREELENDPGFFGEYRVSKERNAGGPAAPEAQRTAAAA